MSTRYTLVSAFVAASLVLPALAFGQATATTICKDSTTSTVSGRGACSGHGGVDRAATKAARAAAKARKSAPGTAATTAAATAMVTCTDGSTSKGGRGACRGHGGVNKGASAARSTATPATPAATAASPSPSTKTARASRDASTGMAAGKSSAHENTDPSGAIAQCKDGLYSHAAHRKGACSKHGGVAKWLTPGGQ
ncbi:MAG TPA: DUF3761 domain-containing protein [Gemmatimonadaceae bacterium]|jgi:hypothetical protein